MIDITHWIPSRWEEVLCNRELVEHFQDILRGFLGGATRGVATMPLGCPRSGKTSTAKFFVRCALCAALDPSTLNPCGRCKNCLEADVRFAEEELFAYHRSPPVHYMPIDCTRVTQDRLNEVISGAYRYEGIRIVFLDEVHRLQRRNMDEQLLKPLEEADCTWIASSATTAGLERMFLNRFVKIRTHLPSLDDLALWLGARCKEWGIEWTDSADIERLAERSAGIPGLALPVLARALLRPDRTLTRQLIESHLFDVEDGG